MSGTTLGRAVKHAMIGTDGDLQGMVIKLDSGAGEFAGDEIRIPAEQLAQRG